MYIDSLQYNQFNPQTYYKLKYEERVKECERLQSANTNLRKYIQILWAQRADPREVDKLRIQNRKLKQSLRKLYEKYIKPYKTPWNEGEKTYPEYPIVRFSADSIEHAKELVGFTGNPELDRVDYVKWIATKTGFDYEQS